MNKGTKILIDPDYTDERGKAEPNCTVPGEMRRFHRKRSNVQINCGRGNWKNVEKYGSTITVLNHAIKIVE